MSKKVNNKNFWGIVCFIALACYACNMLFSALGMGGQIIGIVSYICDIIIALVIVVSAWNFVAPKSKGWKIAFWVFVAIILVMTILVPALGRAF